ncbi:hypothetical protein I4F81_003819 [Pyropia yezoensis]|uniref:Uncharacterized protein n=1 Tax=Pyropia yezoensis TaxID=2788 RepID=A0ACC3BTN0_PYRYE|nr:hypothetical protein I4F81_003819 [Neopyropia yezoensis]
MSPTLAGGQGGLTRTGGRDARASGGGGGAAGVGPAAAAGRAASAGGDCGAPGGRAGGAAGRGAGQSAGGGAAGAGQGGGRVAADADADARAATAAAELCRVRRRTIDAPTLETVYVSGVSRDVRQHRMRALLADVTGVDAHNFVDVDRFGATTAVTVVAAAADTFRLAVGKGRAATVLRLLPGADPWSPALLGAARRRGLDAAAAAEAAADFCRRRLEAKLAQLPARVAMPPHLRAALHAHIEGMLSSHAQRGADAVASIGGEGDRRRPPKTGAAAKEPPAVAPAGSADVAARGPPAEAPPCSGVAGPASLGLRGAAEAAGMEIVDEPAASADGLATPAPDLAATTACPPPSPPAPGPGPPAKGVPANLGDGMDGVTPAGGAAPPAATPTQKSVAASAAPRPRLHLGGGPKRAAVPRAAAGLPPLPPPPTRPPPGAARSAAFAASVALPLGVAARRRAATDRRRSPAGHAPGPARRQRPALAVLRLGDALASPIRKTCRRTRAASAVELAARKNAAPASPPPEGGGRAATTAILPPSLPATPGPYRPGAAARVSDEGHNE